MRSLANSLIKLGVAAGLAGAATVGVSGVAAAQGFYLNAPGIHIGVGRPYHHYYRPRYYDYAPGYYGGGSTWNGCPPHFTIQDGACKPYRGY